MMYNSGPYRGNKLYNEEEEQVVRSFCNRLGGSLYLRS